MQLSRHIHGFHSRYDHSKNYKSALIKTIKAGGCNCSRANFVGAYFAALKGIKGIPHSWIKKTIPAKKIINVQSS